MADNVTIDNGTLTDFVAASDDVGGVQYPFVKIASGTLNDSAVIPGDATNGLDVDVTRIVPGTGATHLGKAGDAAHASGDTGVMALTVRADTVAATAGATGDYQPLMTDASGQLYVALATLPDANVTGVTPGTDATDLGKAEDAAHSSGDTGVSVLAVRQDTLGSSTSIA